MELSLRRWRPGQLLGSWAAYWVGLAAVTLSSAASAVWRATHLPDGHGSITIGFDNNILQLGVIEEGVKTYNATASLGAIMLWVIGPPLALWLVWLAVRKRPDKAPRELRANDLDQLPAGTAPAAEWRQADRVRADAERIRTPNP